MHAADRSESAITVVGASPENFTRAAEAAIEEAARTVKGIRAAEVVRLSTVVNDDRVVEYRAAVILVLDD
jgi:flavin-binding protein dodecin